MTSIRTELWWLDDQVRASPKWQLLWVVPIIKGSVPTTSSTRKDDWWTSDRVTAAYGSVMRQARMAQSHIATCHAAKNCSGMVQGTWRRVQVVDLTSWAPRSQLESSVPRTRRKNKPDPWRPHIATYRSWRIWCQRVGAWTTGHLQGSGSAQGEN